MSVVDRGEALSVLVVEDNPADVDLIRTYLDQLEERSFRIKQAGRFEEGRRIADEDSPDVVLMDLTLPDSGAGETVERIAELPREVAVIVLTGGPSRELELTALQRGAEEFLQKDALEVALLEKSIDHAVERRRIRSRMVEQQQRLERYKTIVENTTDAVVVLDAEGRYQLVNAAFERQLDRLSREVVGKRPVEVYGREMGEEIERRVDRALAGGETETTEETIEVADGERTFLTTRIPLEDGGEPDGLIAIARDITERKRMRDDLQHRALYDQLTGLPNRGLFYDRLRQAIQRARRRKLPFAVAFVDLDEFKAVNDSFGHAAGDDVMCKAARRLQESTRDEDTVARVGGDEFVVLVEAVENAEVLDQIGRRLSRRFDPPFRLGDEDVHMSVSIGFAYPCPETLEADGEGEEMDELTRTADRAMYEAKRMAGTSWWIADPSEQGGETSGRIQQRNRVRQGLQNGEFFPHYQPIYRLDSGEMFAVEVLSRWEDPERGMVSPGEFIPLVEQTELICDLGVEIAAQVCEDFRKLYDAESVADPMRVFVNLSPRQIAQPERLGHLCEVFEETMPAGVEVSFEVTETDLLEHHSQVVDLRDRGFEVLVDDFGTGYSSLSRLEEMPVDGLKLDMEFVHGIGKEGNDGAIAETIVQLGDVLGIPVVAEGIETDEQLEFLVEAGCEAGQGFGLARPEGFESLKAKF